MILINIWLVHAMNEINKVHCDEMKHSIGSDNPYDNDSRIGQQVISVILSMILSILSMDG